MKSRDWKALKKTEDCIVDGQEITFRKRGTARLLGDVAQIPVLGDAIEHFVGASLKSKSSTVDAMKEAVAKAAEDGNLDAGKVLRDLVANLPRVIVDIIVEDTVLASEDERADYREWVEQLGPSGLVDAVTGWVGLNLPEFRDPLVRGLTAVLRQGDQIVKAMQVAAQPQTTSANDGAPAAPAKRKKAA